MNRTIAAALTLLCALSFGLDEAPAQGKNGKGKGGNSAAKGGGSSKNKTHNKEKPSKNDKGPNKHTAPSRDKAPGKLQGTVSHRFKAQERTEILTFWDQYKGHDHGLPPGLAKNLRRGKPLPPGWEKKVGVGSIIDRELWDTFDRVPRSYLPKGFVLPPGTGMFLYGDRMLRVRESDRTVLDTVRIPSIRL